MNLGVVFGTKSTEHEVSVVSATSIIKNLDKEKYNIYPIYLDKNNNWFEVVDDVREIDVYKFGSLPKNIKPIENVFSYLKKMDVIFPVLHGVFGEDGTIQGLLEMLEIPYVGCGVLTSSVAMDKFYTKILLKKHFNMARDICVCVDDDIVCLEEGLPIGNVNLLIIDKMIKSSFGYPVFVKPSRLGSSVGVSKASDLNELKKAIDIAKCYDKKILIEEEIKGRELECAVFKNQAYAIGEVKAADTFYNYTAKYTNAESKTVIPADIPKEIEREIQDIASKAFQVIDGSGLSRVDFFLEDETNKIYINEINTLPGFTEISMYPKLMEASGINYSKLLDDLIDEALNKS